MVPDRSFKRPGSWRINEYEGWAEALPHHRGPPIVESIETPYVSQTAGCYFDAWLKTGDTGLTPYTTSQAIHLPFIKVVFGASPGTASNVPA